MTIIDHESIAKRFLKMEARTGNLVEKFSLDRQTNIWPCVRIATCLDSGYSLYLNHNLGDHGGVENISLELNPDFYRLLANIPKACVYIDTHHKLYTQRVQGKAYDPYLDQVVTEAFKAGFPAYKVLLTEGPILENPLHPTIELPVHRIKTGFTPLKKLLNFTPYAEYVTSCLNYGVPALHLVRIFGLYAQAQAYAMLFEKILGILQPRMVVMECYYTARQMGLSMACRKLGIPSVDYQHGLHSFPNIHYNFGYIPPDGYNMLPEWFFTWGDKPTLDLQKYFQKQHFHKALTAGKPYYIAWKSNNAPDLSEMTMAFAQALRNKIPVCVVLPLIRISTDTLKAFNRVIQHSPENWIWLFRRHPVYSREDQVQMLENVAHRVEQTMSSTLGLHTVLTHTRHVITCHSTVAFEALSLHGLETTFLAEAGKSYYADYLGHTMRFANTEEAILESIQNGIANYPTTEPEPAYLTGDTSQLGVAIRRVLCAGC